MNEQDQCEQTQLLAAYERLRQAERELREAEADLARLQREDHLRGSYLTLAARAFDPASFAEALRLRGLTPDV